MAMKLKLDDNGNVVVQDGKPVYIYDDGKEVQVDAEQLFSKISELNNESKGHRLKAKEVEDRLAKFGTIDPDSIASTLSEIEALGGLDAIKKGAKVNVDEVKAEIQRAYEAKLSDKDKLISEKDSHIYRLEVSNRFKASPFINEKLTLPPDIAEATFGQSFKIEDGQVVAYLGGNKIYSRERPGEPANFEEAVQAIIEAYPMKDRILKGSGASGSGSQGAAGGKSFGGIRSRADFKTDSEKSAYISEHGLDAFKQLPVS